MGLLLFAESQDAGNLRRQDSLCWMRVDVLEIVILFVRSVQPLLLSVSLYFKILSMNTENCLLIGVATERGEKVGETIGYSIRGETVKSNKTRLLFCTTGILLRILQNDPTLSHITHVTVDEVHERSVDSDFLLVILKQVVKVRPDFRLVLMSATIYSEPVTSSQLCLFSNCEDCFFESACCIMMPGHPLHPHSSASSALFALVRHLNCASFRTVRIVSLKVPVLSFTLKNCAFRQTFL
jgi:hypothetical protein